MACALTIFVGQYKFSEKYSCGHPPETALDRPLFPLFSAPSLTIDIGLSMSDSPECKPHQEACNGEEVFGRNKQCVINEEAIDEVQSQKELLIEDYSELLVACEYGPFAY